MNISHSRDTAPEASAAARAAHEGWARLSPEERGQALSRAADALEEAAQELAGLHTLETGRLPADARGGIDAAVGTLRQYAELGPLHQGQRLRGGMGALDYSIPEPRGVVAVITPWNDPVAIACGLIGAALVTGNTVVHKPSERCPRLGERLGEVLAGALPQGVLITLNGPGQVGAELVSQPDTAMIAHVGSTATGERILRMAALTGAHVILENGGNDPLIIDDGVDVRWAARQAALGCYAGAGQICTSVERIFVHERIADRFLDALLEETLEWRQGGRLGPLVDERLRTEVHRQVMESVDQGATLLTGGRLPGAQEASGAFYPATVVTDCTPLMPLFTQETFGPVAAIARVPNFAEGLSAAAEDPHGLAATVLTTSMVNATRAAEELPVGTVKINNVFGGAPGGSAEPRGASGRGFGYGPKLLDEMTRLKVVHRSAPDQEE